MTKNEQANAYRIVADYLKKGGGKMTKKEHAAVYRVTADYLKKEGFPVTYRYLLAKADELDPPAPARDPYLVPGARCEVWADSDYANPNTFMKYFSARNNDDQPTFVNRRDVVGDLGSKHDHYRVIGTPWDHAPEKAEWVATDRDGQIHFCETKPEVGYVMWDMSTAICSAGYDAAVESGEVNWRTTLRRRPEWARRREND